MQPATRATCHVTGCTHTARIRSVEQKLSSKMRRCGDAVGDINIKGYLKKKSCFGLKDSCYIYVITTCVMYPNNSSNSANSVDNHQEKNRAITCAWQKLFDVCNQSHDRLHATPATSHMTGCMQPLQPVTSLVQPVMSLLQPVASLLQPVTSLLQPVTWPVQPVMWLVACNPGCTRGRVCAGSNNYRVWPGILCFHAAVKT